MKTFPRALSSVFLVCSLLFASWTPAPSSERLALEAESTIWIEGTSTIHDWLCDVKLIDGFLDIESADGLVAIEQIQITVPISEIDCDNGTMNRKMSKALQADSHPTIEFALDNKWTSTEHGGTSFEVDAEGILTIAGFEKPTSIVATGERLAQDRFSFKGIVPLTMTEFGVSPPKAMMGTLKTGDEVAVHFDVVVSTPK